jgi:ABC-type multidrug transport system fused ATPase/permease subunit
MKNLFTLKEESSEEKKEKKEEKREEKGIDKLSTTTQDNVNERNETLSNLKLLFREFFGTEKLPDDLVREFGEIKHQIREEVSGREYLDNLEEFNETLKLLVLKIAKYKEIQAGIISTDNLLGIDTNEKGELKYSFDDEITKEIILDNSEKELLSQLHLYFDSCRIAYNGNRFKSNIENIKDSIVEDNKSRKLNFYNESEKQSEVVNRLERKYKDIGLTRDELGELAKMCDLEKLDALEVNKIGLKSGLRKIRNIFDRFLNGDKTKYIALSVALLVPAGLEGWAPNFMAEAFKGNSIEVTQIAIYALLSSGAIISSSIIEKYFKDFLNKSYNKEGGVGEKIADDLKEFPADEIKKFGIETVKNRVSNAKESYGDLLKTISFDIAPAITSSTISALMLYDRSPALAAGTAVSTGMMIALDKYFYKKSKFWEKQNRAQQKSEESREKIDEQLSAHMEIILSGEKDKFKERIHTILNDERISSEEKNFLKNIQQKYFTFASVLNSVIVSAAAAIANGSADKFVAGLIYSQRLAQNIGDLFRSKMKILNSLRDIEEMEKMFNGYSEEEVEKEKNRIGINEVKNNDIDLKNVSLNFKKESLFQNANLHIPAGSMVRLSGDSGAGKTTLIKIITGYYKPTEGQVDLGNTDIENIKKSGDNSIYSRIAYLSQYPYIFDDSLKNNLTFGMKNEISNKQITEILKEVGLDERFKNINEKLLGGRGDSGVTSGGETSRIGLARTILKIRNTDSKLVILDEPTASVDKSVKERIVELIKKEKEKRPNVTFIIISHDDEFVKMLDCNMEVQIKDKKIEIK